MENAQVHCINTCKGRCTSLEIAALREREAQILYEELRDHCDYPDVRSMLDELIRRHIDALTLIDETRRVMAAKFQILDEIRAGFEE